ncbi:SpoIIE family protein phosphatase [Paenibacillus sp. TRM 82003]|uniref:SpoIIE family protein phosphatase n=1 Tax=Kineococcus sp. TRM81007 TaxID=2925831 RepID=UPI001F56C0B9|nr:SpoIIE family protein phosphatase [Kineococcus sp. TRM81007]MCI2238732.1 SpoIIE family protein phosphatase [Kineococcus sp. TRM81007]MCI3924138.1 SpoIIE family protein phosphatase [Paenibacillus sp. TRM 82003]
MSDPLRRVTGEGSPSPLPDPDGDAATHGGKRDTRVAIEAALLPAVFESPALAVIALDRQGLVTALTPPAERLLGYVESELVGEPLHERLHHHRADGSPLTRRDCPVVAALEGARPAWGDGDVLVRKDGSLLVVDWAFAPVVLARTLTGGVLTFHDPRDRTDRASREGGRLAAAEAANLRLTLLADVSRSLASATTGLSEALGAIARRVVPALADWAAVDLLDERDGHARRVALVHRDPDADPERLARLGQLPPLAPEARDPLAQVLRGAPLQHVQDAAVLDEEGAGVAGAAWSQRTALVRALGAVEAIVAPLRARGRVLGALTLVRTDPARPFQPEDVAFAADLGERAATAVDTTRLLEGEQRRAEQMQRALLPELPGRIGELELHGLYQPAGDRAQVGGDWYDAFPLPDDGVALVLGDVAGHDLHAATRMGAIRHKLRALAADRLDRPSAVLARLDRVLQRFAPSDVATLVLAHLRPGGDGWGVEWSCAGHPPPLLLVPGAAPRLLDVEADLPLGVADLPRHDVHDALPAGATVVFYSDGLVEHPGESLADGLQRLVAAGAGLEDASLPQLCRDLLERVRPAGNDDVAVLAVRPGAAGTGARAAGGGDLVRVRLLGVPLRLRAEHLRCTEALLRELALVRIGARHETSATLPQRLLGLAAELQSTYAPLLTQPVADLDAATAAGCEHCDVTYRVPAGAADFARRALGALEEADEFCRAERHLLTLPAPPGVVAYRRWLVGEFVHQVSGGEPRPWRPPEPQQPAAATVGRAGADGRAPAGGGPVAPEGAGWSAVGEPLRLDPEPGAAAAARRHVRRLLRDAGAGEVEEAAELGVSELVTNAVLHARTPASVTVRTAPSGAVRVEVADASAAAVQERRFGPEAATGRGLRLVASISTAWGVDPLPAAAGPGKVVWFEPSADTTAAAAAGDAGQWGAQDWAAGLL